MLQGNTDIIARGQESRPYYRLPSQADFLKIFPFLIIFNVSECVVVFLSSLSTRKENIIFCADHKWSRNRLFFECFALLLGEFRSCCVSDLEALSWQIMAM
jgi:hypothetical protein